MRLAFLASMCLLSSCLEESNIPISSDFEIEVLDNNYSVPVYVRLHNKSQGALFYRWITEGSSLPESDMRTPEVISYKQPGKYKIILECGNNDEKSIKELVLDLDSALNISFEARFVINNLAPAQIELLNNSSGANSYKWSFEGCDINESSDYSPATVTFPEPGEYVIKLSGSNERIVKTDSMTIVVGPKIESDFEIIPHISCENFEAPFEAAILYSCEGVTEVEWQVSRGVQLSVTDERPEIRISDPGEYTITMISGNGKHKKELTRNLTVLPNTNLISLSDIPLSIYYLHINNQMGAFYSINSRKVVNASEAADFAGIIDIVFYGINKKYSYCCFTSPDVCHDFGFKMIDNAVKTKFRMIDDIHENEAMINNFLTWTDGSQPGNLETDVFSEKAIFDASDLRPRIILFITHDNRKGAIYLKEFIQSDNLSYILTDIKLEKQANQ